MSKKGVWGGGRGVRRVAGRGQVLSRLFNGTFSGDYEQYARENGELTCVIQMISFRISVMRTVKLSYRPRRSRSQQSDRYTETSRHATLLHSKTLRDNLPAVLKL